MNSGQADIDNHGTNTTFCLSGTHNWSLTPKTGDQLVGPAVLDGGKSTQFAIQPGSANGVTISNLEIRNYVPGHGFGAIQASGTTVASGWTLQNLWVHDNGTSAGGIGVSLGSAWQVLGGRYDDNAEAGLDDYRGDGVVVDGAELDHNNFTDHSYTKRNTSCGDEAAGFKWFANNVTVRNARVHDNACAGLWADGNAHNSVVTNNTVYNNWNEGIFIEISSYATITGNTVYGNAFYGGDGSNNNFVTCSYWIYGGGISMASSDHVEIANNNVYGNCQGITGGQEYRADGNPGQLEDVSVHDNTITGPGGETGVSAYPTMSLAGRDIVFTNNTFSNGMNFCNLSC